MTRNFIVEASVLRNACRPEAKAAAVPVVLLCRAGQRRPQLQFGRRGAGHARRVTPTLPIRGATLRPRGRPGNATESSSVI